MSHFVGLVITTPDYQGSMDDSLAKYNENIRVEPYVDGKVTAVDMFNVVSEYTMSETEEESLKKKAVDFIKSTKGDDFFTMDKYRKEYETQTKGMDDKQLEPYYLNTLLFNKERYKDDFNEYLLNHTDVVEKFPKVYEENGMNWNNNVYKKNADGIWEEWTTYNSDSKWDWYTFDFGCRWLGYLRTKEGKYVNECKLSEIDLDTPNGEKPDNWHLADDLLPFCVVIDGEWHERAIMGFWAFTRDEMPLEEWEKKVKVWLTTLPQDSDVTAVDFHI